MPYGFTSPFPWFHVYASAHCAAVISEMICKQILIWLSTIWLCILQGKSNAVSRSFTVVQYLYYFGELVLMKISTAEGLLSVGLCASRLNDWLDVFKALVLFRFTIFCTYQFISTPISCEWHILHQFFHVSQSITSS